MTMVLISEGMQLKIPASGLVIPLDGSTPPPVSVQVRLDTWQHWLRIAVANVALATQAHKRLLVAHTAKEDASKGAALEEEFRAPMVAMTSAAFALDGFYASLKERIPLEADLQAAWAKNRTGRAVRISETLGGAFILTPSYREVFASTVAEVFKWRDRAVHAPARYLEPLLHPDLGVGVE
jgi:hypothetical protein